MIVEVPFIALACYAVALICALFISIVKRKANEMVHKEAILLMDYKRNHWMNRSNLHYETIVDLLKEWNECEAERAKLQRQVTGLKSHVSRLRRERDNWKASFYEVEGDGL